MSVNRAEIAFYVAMRSWATRELYLTTVEDIIFSGRFGVQHKQRSIARLLKQKKKLDKAMPT